MICGDSNKAPADHKAWMAALGEKGRGMSRMRYCLRICQTGRLCPHLDVDAGTAYCDADIIIPVRTLIDQCRAEDGVCHSGRW